MFHWEGKSALNGLHERDILTEGEISLKKARDRFIRAEFSQPLVILRIVRWEMHGALEMIHARRGCEPSFKGRTMRRQNYGGKLCTLHSDLARFGKPGDATWARFG